jgi:hypothetical protein
MQTDSKIKLIEIIQKALNETAKKMPWDFFIDWIIFVLLIGHAINQFLEIKGYHWSLSFGLLFTSFFITIYGHWSTSS